MELTISTADLQKALYLTQSIVEKRTTMPILSNVLLSAQQGKLKISATDLEITAITEVSAAVKSNGSTTVNAKIFADIVKELNDGSIHLKLSEGERLEINSGGSKLKIIGVSADEYPSLPGVGFEVKTKIASQQMLEMISRTIHAVSTDETRFNLNGICFEAEGQGKKSGGTLRLVSTDGHRLAMITRPCGAIGLTDSVIVPRKGISEIRKLLEGENREVGIGFHEGFLVIDSEGTKVSVRLIDGEFPDYNQVIPKDKGVNAIVPSKALIQALKRVSLMVTDKGKCIKLDFSKNHLRLSSSSPELGEASEELVIEYAGEPLTAGFNARYLSDFCLSLGEDQSLVMELHGELGPGRFYSSHDQSYIGIIMPMRLSSE